MVTVRCGTIAFPNVQAIVFDKDGTLADSRLYLTQLARQRVDLVTAQFPTVQVPLALAFGLQGNCLDPGGLMAVGTRSENEKIAAACIAATGCDWLTAWEIVQSAFQQADRALQPKADHTPPFAGINPLLERCVSAGLKLAILSSDARENVQAFVDRYELAQFQQLAGADMDRSKPDPILLQRVCDRLGIPVQSALMVGDATVDIEMAKAAGAMGSIGVTWGGANADSLQAASALGLHPQDLSFDPVT